MTIKSMPLLEVLIPTYNRINELGKCLDSLEKAVKYLPALDRCNVSIVLRSNSTKNLSLYQALIEKYACIFQGLGVAYFNFHITGFNIGAANNIAGGMFSANSQYVWVLSDDDIARFDSLSIALSAIKRYSPCFIRSGATLKATIQYDSNESGEDDRNANAILDTISERAKVSTFLSDSPVAMPNFIYNVQILKEFLVDDSNISLLDPMLPGILAIFCLQSSQPFVRLERNLAIYREGEPNSEWRHLWYRYTLINWAILSEKSYQKGWLNKEEFDKSVAFYRRIVFPSLSRRPDILLGLNKRYGLNPFVLLKFHRHDFLHAIKHSPSSVLVAKIKQLGRGGT